MSSQPTIPAPAPVPTVPELHPADMANLPPGVSMQNVPAFEQPTAASSQLLPGESGQNFADPRYSVTAHAPGVDTVYADTPEDMTQPILNHEVMHLIQNRQREQSYKAGVEGQEVTGVTDSSAYDYGGVDGLEHMLGRGQNLSHLTNEQRAAVLQDYTEKMQNLRARGTAADPKMLPSNVANRNSRDPVRRQMQRQIDAGYDEPYKPEVLDRMNRVYGPFIRQMGEMARTGDTINTTPAPPGPPPAALTGAVKPLPEIGGRTIELHANDLANHPGRKK